MEICAVIPARGGSKGIPRKNIKILAGKPLLYYTIIEARKSNISRVIVSTEDKEITEIALKYGAEVVRRPKELAGDDVTSMEVVLHTLNFLKNKENPFKNSLISLPEYKYSSIVFSAS